MRKRIVMIAFASSVAWGGENVHLIASSIEGNESFVHANGSPVVLYDGQMIYASKLEYDRNRSIIDLHGPIYLFKDQYHARSDRARLDLAHEEYHFEPYYAFDESLQQWLSTDSAHKCQSDIDLAQGVVSGCDSTDPLWKIHFSSASYNEESQWINLYNARIELNDTPVFYLPYFGYPTDTRRRSGLLIPIFGYSNSQGIYYHQPIYFAPKHWWDFELRPQIRTQRGRGVYGDFRFVDTPSSEGSIGFGYFQEQDDYVQRYSLAHDTHYGYELKYRHSDPLNEWFDLDWSGQSGLYLNAERMSDIDYLNLRQSDETKSVAYNQVISRFNGFYNGEFNYFGVYGKYYQYLDKSTNAQTIQTWPMGHYHRYLESFWNNHMLLNADVSSTYYYRDSGKRAQESIATVPLTLYTTLAGGVVDVHYNANATGRVITFDGAPNVNEGGNLYESGYYAQLDHTINLSSVLIRPYGTLNHVLNPTLIYTSSGKRLYEGYYATYHSACVADPTQSGCDYYHISEPKDSVSVGVNNYLFEGYRTWINDRIYQTFTSDQYGRTYGELQNEFEYFLGEYFSYYNQTYYNHDRQRVTKEQNVLRYNTDTVRASLSHYYTDQLSNTVVTYNSYLMMDGEYRYGDHYRWFGSIMYDYTNDIMKRSEVGFLFSKRCLDFGIRYVQNRRPVTTTVSTNDYLNDSYLFVTLVLKPLGGPELNYKLNKNSTR